MTFVYYAEPIDFMTLSNQVEIETRMVSLKLLMRNGAKVYRPGTAWVQTGDLGGSVTSAEATVIDTVNREALERADILVARLPQGAPSHGVPMEIEYATRTLGMRAIVHNEAPGVALLSNPLVTVVGNMVDLETEFVRATKALPKKTKMISFTGNLQEPHYPGDAGYDLRSMWDVTVPAGRSVLIPTGSSLQIPEGCFGWVVARSSSFQNFGIQVLPGVIDEGYTGELYVNAFNPTDEDSLIGEGERIAQIVIIPNMRKGLTLEKVNQLAARDRGSNGFGSTG